MEIVGIDIGEIMKLEYDYLACMNQVRCISKESVTIWIGVYYISYELIIDSKF